MTGVTDSARGSVTPLAGTSPGGSMHAGRAFLEDGLPSPSPLATLSRGTSLDLPIAIRLFSGAIDPEDVPGLNGDDGEDGMPELPMIPETGDVVHPVDDTPLARMSRDGAAAAAAAAAAADDAEDPPAAGPSAGGSLAGSRTSSQRLSLARLSSLTIKDEKVADQWMAASAYLKSSWQYQVTGRASAAAVLSEFGTERIHFGGPKGIHAFAVDLIHKQQLEDTFYLYDLGNVTRMWKSWRRAIPRVTPHYAVKCNPEPALLKLLVGLGAGFDCASKAELATVLALGVPQNRIIFAHPCKRTHDILYAKEHHVEQTTFDTLSELDKVATLNPRFKCVLRIRADDPDAVVKLGLKYGADPEDAPELLEHAKKLGLQVVGVSFHVGSGARNLSVFAGAIATARHIFDMAELMGFHMELLDIGGGFTGHFDERGEVMFGGIAPTINQALDEHFPEEMGVRIIAEPGRFFAETSATLFAPVYGKRDRADVNGGVKKDYWITDGLYGSFNCIVYDDQRPAYQVLWSPLLPDVMTEPATFKSTIWGPTCDSADCVYKDVPLPELRVGDWLMFPNAGAYTVAGACDFNGINMTQPLKFYVFSDRGVDLDVDDGDGTGATNASEDTEA